MKAEIKGVEFIPFTLEIKLESKEEAQVLWHRLNASIAELGKGASLGVCSLSEEGDADEAWLALRDYMEVHDLMKGE